MHLAPLAKELSHKSGLNVKIQSGKVVIAFDNEEELAEIAKRLS